MDFITRRKTFCLLFVNFSKLKLCIRLRVHARCVLFNVHRMAVNGLMTLSVNVHPKSVRRVPSSLSLSFPTNCDAFRCHGDLNGSTWVTTITRNISPHRIFVSVEMSGWTSSKRSKIEMKLMNSMETWFYAFDAYTCAGSVRTNEKNVADVCWMSVIWQSLQSQHRQDLAAQCILQAHRQMRVQYPIAQWRRLGHLFYLPFQ